jgi:hypothetical protein
MNVDAVIIRTLGNARWAKLWLPQQQGTCYFVDRQALFTGDTLFLTGVGRPDTNVDLAEVEAGANRCAVS